MESYVADKSQYIYWSTPQCRNDIRIGDKAFIWRALGGDGPRGIIATGTVEELPRLASAATLSRFRHPQRVWVGEEAASSTWKTGISLSEVRLRAEGMLTTEMLETACSDLTILRMPRATVYRLNTEQCDKIERLWASATA
jgi:hypothetical protein